MRLLKKYEDNVEDLVAKIIEVRRKKLLGKKGFIRSRLVGGPIGNCGRAVLTAQTINLDSVLIP